jgi:alkanesulfonate monooxygenase SsuD/methylene tetrahydromethanopterin reductase-like flavin-dependent oxidoreductase (luciferase family)
LTAATTPARPNFVVVEGRFLPEDDLDALRLAVTRAEADGAGAVFFGPGPLGDPFVLAAGLSADVTTPLLGVRVRLSTAERHPAMLAREATSLDHICGGRTVLTFLPPFTDATAEAIALCRALWRDGVAEHGGVEYVVDGAVNRPRPPTDRSPLVALDTTGSVTAPVAGSMGNGVESAAPPSGLTDAADLILLPTQEPDRCVVERVHA